MNCLVFYPSSYLITQLITYVIWLQSVIYLPSQLFTLICQLLRRFFN